MDSGLEDLFNLYQFPTGRRMFALRQLKPIAGELELKPLVSVINKALDHDAKTLVLEASWDGGAQRGGDPQRVKKIDQKVDRMLSAIRDVVAGHAAAADADDEVAAMAEELLQGIFPAGVNAVTSLSFVEELVAVESILKSLRGPFEKHVAELGIGRMVKRLAALTAEYRAAQEQQPKEALTFGQVRAARATGQQCLLHAVALIVGTYPADTPEHRSSRAKLLAPILAQNEAVRQALKGRRAVDDVDPEAGEVRPGAPQAAQPASAGSTPTRCGHAARLTLCEPQGAAWPAGISRSLIKAVPAGRRALLGRAPEAAPAFWRRGAAQTGPIELPGCK